ncbi:MAG TPA: DUF6498-containing protein [Candidatus Limnocylindria bacterium]
MSGRTIAPSLVQRAFEVYRVNSSPVAVALLVLFNLVPLAGVLWLGWNLVLILALYWVENGVVGVINILKILRAEGTGTSSSWTMNGRPISEMSRLAVAGFFSFHYGLFWVVHGAFVLFFIPALAGDLIGAQAGAFVVPLVLPDLGVLALGAVGLGISHAVSFWTNYIERGEFRTLSPAQVMTQPYGRLVIMHLTILVGAFVSIFLATPVGSLLVLIVGKTALDLAFHLRQHRPPEVSLSATG